MDGICSDCMGRGTVMVIAVGFGLVVVVGVVAFGARVYQWYRQRVRR